MIGMNILAIFFAEVTLAQTCPPNIDFEEGSFNNWTCITGTIRLSDGPSPTEINVSNTPPIPGRHTIFSSASIPQVDRFGGFPVLSPNGSKYAVKIGNDEGGGVVNGVSYELQVPAGQDQYFFQYSYAVVYESPNHAQELQPRFEIFVTDMATGALIDCSSISFFPDINSPGFLVSPITSSNNNVLYKTWTPSTLFLKGLGGKKVNITFRVTGCAYSQHFGYAYIDVNSTCQQEFPGAAFCAGDTTVNVSGPDGYASYTWYNNAMTQVLGSRQILRLNAAPANGTTLALVTQYFYKSYCKDTFYVTLNNTLSLVADAGDDKAFCSGKSVQIGAQPKAGVRYRWQPAAGLSSDSSSNPMANPLIPTRYILTVSSAGGGNCIANDTVFVSPAAFVDTVLQLVGKPGFCKGTGDSAVLMVQALPNIAWFRNGAAITGAMQPRLPVTQSGTYYALVSDNSGCSYKTSQQTILVGNPLTGIRYPQQTISKNFSYPLAARKLGATAMWSPATFLDNPASFEPVFNGSQDITYNIALRDSAGCAATDTQFVKVVDKIELYVPTAFTPNGDGLNDYLKPILFGMKELKYFKVFNRLGNLVFDINWNARGWDGNFKSARIDNQVMVWMAEAIGIDGKVYQRKGSVQVIQ